MVDNGLLLAKGLVHRNQEFRLNLDAPEVNNPHLALVGGSGSGKTTLMKKIIEDLYLKGKTIFLIDFHGDMEVSGENYIKFTPRNSPNGVSIFELEFDEECGGVNIQAEIITSNFNQYFMDNKLGKKQLNELKQLIINVYKMKDINDKDSNTWHKELPTMEDLEKLILYIRKVIDRGYCASNRVLEESISNVRQYLPEKVKSKEVLSSLKKLEDVIGDIEETEEHKEFGDIDFNYYLNPSIKRVFESLYVYLIEIVKMPIFKGEKPVIKKGINRLDFSAFTQTNKPLIAKFLAEFIAQKLFRASMVRGVYENLRDKAPGSKFDRVIIMDESKLALPHGNEKNNPFNIMNRITTEARKFGISLILASQGLQHYSEEMLSNIYTKIVLKTKSNNFKEIARVLGLKEDFIEDTFSTTKGRPAIIETKGTKYSYLVEKFD